MLAAGTMRFTDAPDTPDTLPIAGDFDGASFPKQSPRAPPGRDASRENAVAEDDAFRLGEVVRELTTPDAAPEPATRVRGERNFERRNVETYRATRDALEDVEDAFEDAEDAFEDAETPSNDATISDATTTSNDVLTQDVPFKTLRGFSKKRKADDDTPVVNDVSKKRNDFSSDLSSLREWTRELRAYQRAFALEGVNGESAERNAGAFLRTHLARADAAVREMVARRDALVAQTRAMPLDARGASAARKSRLLRKLQLFDAEAFAALSDVAEAQTRRFFEPLREVSASVFARFLKSKFSGAGCSEDRAVDFAAVGKAGARLERRHGGESGLALGRALRVNAVGSAGAFQTNAFVSNGTAANVASERDGDCGDYGDGVFEMDGVFRRDGGGRSGWTEFGVARRSRRTARANGARGPIARPDVDEGVSRRDAYDRAARSRATRLVSSLRASGPRDLLRDLAFDPSSFARTVESVFDVASLVAGGEAALEANEAGDDLRARAADPRDAAEERKDARLSGGEANDTGREPDENENGAFVLRLDLATWRAMGGAADELEPQHERSDEDEGDAFGFGFGLDDDDEGDINNGVSVFDSERGMFRDGVRMRGIMPLGADPFEALLDDDFDAASRAHHSLNLAPREGAIVAGMAYVYREGFMDETFFRNWASDMLVTFYHFSLAATEGGPAHALATRAVWRVARHWLESNPEMPPGATSEDVLFFNEGCYVLRALGIPHESLARQLDQHLARFESRDYFRGLDLSKPDSYRVRAESHHGKSEPAPRTNVDVAKHLVGRVKETPRGGSRAEDTKDGVLEVAAEAKKKAALAALPSRDKNKKRGKRVAKTASRVSAGPRGPRRLLDVGDGDVKKFNTALIWSFFFKESGAEEKTFEASETDSELFHSEQGATARRSDLEKKKKPIPIWRGDKAEEIRAAADAEVDLRHALALHPDDARAALDFDDVCYFVTHKIFVATNWGLRRLRREEWRHERAFLKTHLPYAVKGAKHGYGDVHLVGEFVQCLRCFDDVARVDPDVAEATRWMCSRQNKQTGGWEVLDADFKNSYHATICALGALLTPKMRGVAEKARKKDLAANALARARSGARRKSGPAETAIGESAPRRSARAVARVSLTEAETRERREAWDAARARPWETAKRQKRFA